MVHCGDGLDASLQITSITNILLNSGKQKVTSVTNILLNSGKLKITSITNILLNSGKFASNFNHKHFIEFRFVYLLRCIITLH